MGARWEPFGLACVISTVLISRMALGAESGGAAAAHRCKSLFFEKELITT